ncbi:class I SAM-dependent methyltransferase [Sphingosinicella terrae]|uniref:class I SAM-dependent methyltransferase n=1 Tax=Sphingosinicella terrae TaxID=2172047 RepID=UPI000E0D7466|nr:SAM-dependent methyltransferase [Sphingosinicella terrae]
MPESARPAAAGGDVAERLAGRIAREGPISVADYMAEANAHYYATRDPFGRAGDFVTAPEISQMFGELIGIWLADLWIRAGRPSGLRYVELGPGRGTLAQDALRAMRGAGLEPPLELVETSPVLRRAQSERLPPARWHDDLSTVPDRGPLLIVANEFFDALPVHQYGDGRELRVHLEGGRFVRENGSPVTEASPASVAIVRDLSRRLVAQSGAALIVDYGHDRTGVGDTLQAVAGHAFADPWEAPGSRDLTAHVDFAALAAAARSEGVRICGPTTQGDWLEAMGIQIRAASLAKAAPERTAEIAAARHRLIAPSQMGRLFKAMALVAPSWPEPVGF